MRANGKGADGGGDDEGLGVVRDQRGKGAGGTLDDRFLSGDEVEDVHAAVGVMRYSAREAMAAGLNELELVQAGPLFAPAVLSIPASGGARGSRSIRSEQRRYPRGCGIFPFGTDDVGPQGAFITPLECANIDPHRTVSRRFSHQVGAHALPAHLRLRLPR